jgi:hypothetical protein
MTGLLLSDRNWAACREVLGMASEKQIPRFARNDKILLVAVF